MSHDSTPESNSDAHWHQETIDRVMDRIESELSALQRDASDPQRTALRKGREALDEFEEVLRDAAAGEPPDDSPPHEEGDGVDVSEQRKRP